MWECPSIGLTIQPWGASNRSSVRGGPIMIFNGRESEMHPLYPAPKQVRVTNPNVSLLEQDGQSLNRQANRRAENAAYIIFCLSARKPANDTNFKGTNLLPKFG